MTPVAEARSKRRVCVRCGEAFLDPSRTSPRSYCDSCRGPSEPTIPERPVRGKPFTVAHFRAWSARFRLKDGACFRLDPYQAAFLTDLFAREPDGRPTFAELWLIIPEGNGKTTFISLVVLYTITFRAEAWVPVAASSRDQGVDLTYRVSSGFVQRNQLEDEFRLHPGYRQIVHRASQGAAKIFASDAASGDGVDPTLALIEELHRLVAMDLYETWAGKLEKSGGQLVVVSTAGEPAGAFEALRGKLRTLAVTSERDGCFLRAVGEGAVLHEYAVPDGGDPEDLELVLAANPFSGVTMETLRRKRGRPSWNLAHWRRFTCNMPTRSVAAAITEAEWYGAAAEPPPDGVPVWLGLDVGWRGDPTAIVPLWWRDDDWRQFAPAVILQAPADGSQLHPDAVKRALHELAGRFLVERVVMDSHDAKDVLVWIADELAVDVVDRPQSRPDQARDYARFMEALRNGWLRHSGDDGLTRHALNATTRVLPLGDSIFERPARGRGTRDDHRRSIDGLVAAAMVHSERAGLVEAEEDMVFGYVDVGGQAA